MRHAIHPDADVGFAEAVRYYAAMAPELGVRFYREMERLIREVCAYPERFRMFDPPARRHFQRPISVCDHLPGETRSRLDRCCHAHETQTELLARATWVRSPSSAIIG